MDFKKYEKELNEAGYLVTADYVTTARGDVVGQNDPYGTFHSKDDALLFVLAAAVNAELAPKPKDKPKAKKRARTLKGGFKSDDKSTPDINEAWEQ
tara:strand:+ start:513 stop:800 length:288 start_codon:yes stop_codon:yes gene_type:complete